MSTVETPQPGLASRAPRPPVVRLRRGAALAIVLGASGLVAGALSWSFVLAPQLRAAAKASAAQAPQEAAAGKARPAEFVASQPSSYDRLALADLPEPRILGEPEPAPATAAKRPHREASPGRTRPSDLAQASRSDLFFPLAGPAARPAASSAKAPPIGEVEVARKTLAAGTLVPATLLTAIDTVRPGPVIAVVSSDVYDSQSGLHLLAPQGSRLLGRHDGDSRHGEARAFIAWEQLTLPNGARFKLESEPGVDALGAVGVAGQVERRIGQLTIATLFSGAITTLGQLARDKDDGDGGLLGDVGDAAAIEAARIGGRLIDRELQVTPSVRLSPGAPVRVLLTRDLALPVYVP